MTPRAHFLTNLALSLSLAAGALAATATASAQQITRMKVTVPFAFTADKTSLTAGTYYVEVRADHFLRFTNVETMASKVVLVSPDSGKSNSGPSRLTFHRQSGHTYLAQVWTSGSDVHSELISHPKPQPQFEASLQDATFDISTK